MRIVYIEIASRSRYDDTPQLRAADTAQIDMAEAREELVVSGVGCTPPALVLSNLLYVRYEANKATTGAALSLLVLSSNAWAQSTKRLIDEVNPFIGTSNFGTTNPGAVVPNGLMSITPFNVSGSPELNKFDKDKRWWSTPYTADNKFFSGFSHVNLSGVGCLSWGVSSYRLLLAISM